MKCLGQNPRLSDYNLVTDSLFRGTDRYKHVTYQHYIHENWYVYLRNYTITYVSPYRGQSQNSYFQFSIYHISPTEYRLPIIPSL